jgi:hypothetical protein
LVLLVVTAILHKVLVVLPTWQYALGMFFSNIALTAGTIEILRLGARRKRRLEETTRPRSLENQEQAS